jgi:hypothetical protein
MMLGMTPIIAIGVPSILSLIGMMIGIWSLLGVGLIIVFTRMGTEGWNCIIRKKPCFDIGGNIKKSWK